MFKQILPVIIIVSFLLTDCKKEEDSIKPLISFEYPGENTFFRVFDTILVKGSVSDEVKLQSVQINVINEDQIAVTETQDISITGNSMSFSSGFILNDIHLPSGTYYIYVSAFDGHNLAHAYRKIYITEAPQKRLGFYLVSVKPSQVLVSFADSNLNVIPKITSNGDYSASAISSYYQELYVAGSVNAGFKAISTIDNSIRWTVSATSTSFPSFTAVSCYSNKVFLSFYDKLVKAYDGNGNSLLNANLAEGLYPVKTFAFDNYLFVEEKETGSPNKKLVVYHSSTGAGIQETAIDFDIRDFFEKDYDNIFITGNKGNQGVLKIYNLTGNFIWSPFVVPSGKILASCQVDPNTLLIAMDNNTVYKYQYSSSNFVIFQAGLNASQVRFDPVNNEAIISEGIKLNFYDYVSGSLKGTAINTDSIMDFHILYNK